ncbi:purine-cytosine permease family protein [Pseudonocardia acidicola]|uniref:purine-cytosine permease family protein n=1 Tax=Pseudonocardia acidicola TaxID=2724939 RepID=UPI001EEF837B|nr:cytosine permease [Pseudonocardia acidicola]
MTTVEPFGVDHIPDGERHGKPRSQFFVWFAAGLNFPIVLLGFSASAYGLSLGPAIAAIAVGTLLGSVLMAVMSRMGVRLGVPQQIQARGPLGFLGNVLPVAYINVFAGVGWSAVTAILGGKAFSALTGAPFWSGALGLTAIVMVISVYGYNMIHYFQRLLSIVLAVLFVMITVVAVARGSIAEGHAVAVKATGTGGWITFAGFFLAFLVAWAPFASDYSRYLPDSPASARGTAWFTGIGNFVTLFWLGTLGVLVGNGVGGADAIEALRELTGPFAVPALIAVTLSVLAQNFLNIYGGAISIQTLRIPVSRTQGVILMSMLSFAVCLWGEAGVEDKFSIFLNLTSYFIAPFAAVLLVDFFRGGRSDRSRIPELYDTTRRLEWGAVAWAVGVLASVPFWDSSIYVGPFAEAFPAWGDISMVVAALVAVLVYLGTWRLPPLWRTARRPPATCPDAASPEGAAATDGAAHSRVRQ